MAQLVPLSKHSKKAQKEYHVKQRGSWYGLNPIYSHCVQREGV